jgi:hypothetical protein
LKFFANSMIRFTKHAAWISLTWFLSKLFMDSSLITSFAIHLFPWIDSPAAVMPSCPPRLKGRTSWLTRKFNQTAAFF